MENGVSEQTAHGGLLIKPQARRKQRGFGLRDGLFVLTTAQRRLRAAQVPAESLCAPPRFRPHFTSQKMRLLL